MEHWKRLMTLSSFTNVVFDTFSSFNVDYNSHHLADLSIVTEHSYYN